MRVEKGPDWEIRLGCWETELKGTPVDSVITDPPFSAETLNGQRSNTTRRSPNERRIEYGCLNHDEIISAISVFSAAASRWCVVFGDHVSAEYFRLGFKDVGWYAFPPVPWIKDDAIPRIMADGPSPQHETIAIARPRRRLSRTEKRYRPGWYKGRKARGGAQFISFVGRKPLYLMRALVRDYSEPGDTILDPYCGTGTTVLAAVIEGRKAIGIERDKRLFSHAVSRLQGGYTTTFDRAFDHTDDADIEPPAAQQSLF